MPREVPRSVTPAARAGGLVPRPRVRRILRVGLGLALAGVIGAAVLLVHEVRRVPRTPRVQEQLTDVVERRPRPPVTGAAPSGAPAPERAAPPAEVPPERALQPVTWILPPDVTDPRRPRMMTPPLVEPNLHPTPPNPFQPPPMQMNPDRRKPAY